jgi:hypothetical protein
METSNMTPENFCYWLQGWIELNKTSNKNAKASKETLEMIENHLKLVFSNVTEFKPIPVSNNGIQPTRDGVPQLYC